MKVFERAQALIDYTMIITDNTDRFPKKARFTFVDRMQNMSLEVYRKLKSFKKKYKEGLISEEEIERSYTSWKGHARHGNCYGLIREMDVLYNDIFKEGDMIYDTTNW